MPTYFRRLRLTAATALVAGLVAGTFVSHNASAAEALSASQDFRQAIEQAKGQVSGGYLDAAASSLAALRPATPLEKYMAASLAMEIAVKKRDVVAQRAVIAKIIESGAAPAGQLARLNYIAGYLSYRTGAIDNAIVYLSRARTLGESDPKASLLLVESYARQRNLNDAAKILDETIATQIKSGAAVPASWYDRAASFAYARKDWASLSAANAAKLGNASASSPEWRTAITSYIVGAKPEPEAELDLHRLQAATGAMASERDYQGYAALAAGQGYAAEAKAVIEAGQEKGALAKGDPIAAQLMRSLRGKAITELAAIKPLPGKSATAASGAKAASGGDDLLANSLFTEAVPYYRAALEKGGVDRSRVSTRLGIALARSGDFDGARTALAQVTGRWSEVAAFWMAWANARSAALAATVLPGQSADQT
ncbi:MAG: hypothetical protein R3E04_09785 [Sphingobium sp.]